jgi:hypothetical protein
MRDREAEGLDARYLLQQQREKELNDEEDWYWNLGNYKDESVVLAHSPARIIRNSEGQTVILEGYEVFLYETALQLLAIKRNDPVLMLDIGGGVGGTFNRLAVALGDQIENNRLALIVSNIKASQDEQIGVFEANRESSTDKKLLIRQSHADLESARGLIHHVTGNFRSLRIQRITLPNGKNIKLERNIDFAHERHSLTPQTYTPELDIPEIGHLLSPYGIYSVPSRNVQNLYTVVPKGIVLREAEKARQITQRKSGILVAHGSLVNSFGLQRVSIVESGPYQGTPMNTIIYKGPFAPSIRLT